MNAKLAVSKLCAEQTYGFKRDLPKTQVESFPNSRVTAPGQILSAFTRELQRSYSGSALSCDLAQHRPRSDLTRTPPVRLFHQWVNGDEIHPIRMVHS